MIIDYGLLDSAVNYYSNLGYQPIEVPWIVSQGILNLTRPDYSPIFQVIVGTRPIIKDGLVASGEQGFLALIATGNLPSKGQFLTVTPCFRDDVVDETHQTQFMKLELIKYDTSLSYNLNEDDSELLIMSAHAKEFFELEGIETTHLDTEEGRDLLYHGIELGSYGHRRCAFCQWIYGTGLALPRFSLVLKDVNKWPVTTTKT